MIYSPRCFIESSQKSFRIITYSSYLAHTDEIFKELNILPVYKLKLQRICLQMLYANNSLPEAISELFISILRTIVVIPEISKI